MLGIRLDCSASMPKSCCFPLVKAGICKFVQYDPTADSFISNHLSGRIVFPGNRWCSYLSLTLPPQQSEIMFTVPCGVIPIKYLTLSIMVLLCLCSCKKVCWPLYKYFKTVYDYNTSTTVLSKIHRHSFLKYLSIRPYYIIYYYHSENMTPWAWEPSPAILEVKAGFVSL